MLFVLLYFLSYLPYALLTKASSSLAVLPISTFSCFCTMLTIWTCMGWWKRFRFTWPAFLSGCMSAGIILTSTTAYSLVGVPLLFTILLMKLGVLMQAPVLDVASGRDIPLRAKVALGLCALAILLTFVKHPSFAMTAVTLVLVAIYLAAYVVKLRIMEPYKDARVDPEIKRKALDFLISEQPMACTVALVLVALFCSDWHLLPTWRPWAIGFTSQLTGLFGGLILLQPVHHSISVPLNRSASVLAGVAASYFLGAPLGFYELTGAALVVVAVIAVSRRATPPPVTGPILQIAYAEKS